MLQREGGTLYDITGRQYLDYFLTFLLDASLISILAGFEHCILYVVLDNSVLLRAPDGQYMYL